jgi:hypothetical protein
LVRAISKLASEAGVYNRVEPRRSFNDDSNKRPDILLYNSHLHQGATVAIDVSITHPVSSRLSLTPGSAMHRRESDKKKKYSEICNLQKIDFQGFIFETYGRFNDNVDKFIKRCCQEISMTKGKTYSVLKHQWVTKISAILQSANASFVTKGYRRLLGDEDNEDDDIEIAYYQLPIIK